MRAMALLGVLCKLGVDGSKPERQLRILLGAIYHLLRGEAEPKDRLCELGEKLGIPFGLLSGSELAELAASASPVELGVLQAEVQRAVGRRKALAAYYTKPEGARLMASRVAARLSSGFVAADPFIGSGVTLTALIDAGAEPREVWGFDLDPLAVLVAYAALSARLGEDRVSVKRADAFKAVGFSGRLTADAVLTNPPFTRWELLDPGYREFLLSLVKESQYSRYVSRSQLNLSIAGLFLCDSVLSRGGLLGVVLPASVFYTKAGNGAKRLLREKYSVEALAENEGVSFSVDSGFRELVLIGAKGARPGLTELLRVEPGGVRSLGFVDLRSLHPLQDRNWLSLFKADGRLALIIRALRRGLLVELGRAVRGLVRGVEMYGSDFFLIPNRYWRIVEDRANYVVISGPDTLAIEKRFLVPALRRPGLYSDSVVVKPDYYLLSIPEWEEPSGDLARYVEWGLSSGAAEPAVRAFGGRWYAHVHRQLSTKRPYGKLFLPDKVYAYGRRAYAFLTQTVTTATKNFYVVRGDLDGYGELLALWFNSSYFLSLLRSLGREISGEWTRFVRSDYALLPVPPPEPELVEAARGMLGSASSEEVDELFTGYLCG